MTYPSRNSRISAGLGSSSSLTSSASASSSSMISLHRSMHSSQMYTPGPAMSFLTCFWDLPQNEHFSSSPPSPNLATSSPPQSGVVLVCYRTAAMGPLLSASDRAVMTSSMMPYAWASAAD